MHSRKRAVLVVGIIGAFVFMVTVVSLLQRPVEYPSITLNDGRLFSFVGVTTRNEPLESLKSTWINRYIGDPFVKFIPKAAPIFRKFRITSPRVPNLVGATGKENVVFWFCSRSKDGKSYPNNGINGPTKNVVNGVDILFRDAENKMRLQSKGGGTFPIASNLSYTGIYFLGIRNQLERVVIVLRQKNDQGVLEESAVWKVEIP